jgi:CTP synthase
VITEIGGCVGDIESLPFIEAVRQAKWELGPENALVIHLTLIPYLKSAGELKTKPTQHSVKQLLESGIQPDILVCRTEYELPDEIRRKLALFCNVSIDSVIEAIDAETIYDVPLLMQKEQLDKIVLQKLRITSKKEIDLTSWSGFLDKFKNPKNHISIGLIGKYVDLKDAYKSIAESFIHAGTHLDCKVNIVWIHSEDLEEHAIAPQLEGLDAILVAPGFGERGIFGKIAAVK